MSLTLLGLPTYDNSVNADLVLALLNEVHVPGTPAFQVAKTQMSLLACGFNRLYATALNQRPKCTHFLLLHADVVPENGFVKALHAEMERTGAGILSTVLPLKDNRGLTSTGLMAEYGRPFRRRRVTMTELAHLPQTFGGRDVARLFGHGEMADPVLLVNTGLMLIDLRIPQAEQYYFEITDRIVRNADGSFQAEVDPEDWHLSRMAHEAGVRVLATKTVKARHAGRAFFPNFSVWGEWERDTTEVLSDATDLQGEIREPRAVVRSGNHRGRRRSRRVPAA